jgi:hypothetical protein
MNLPRPGFICAIACNTATPSLLAATDSMATLCVGPRRMKRKKGVDRLAWDERRPTP